MLPMKSLTTIALVLLIGGCASANVASSYDLEAQSSEGLLVVSRSEEGLQSNESAIWSYRRTDGSKTGEVITHYRKEPEDWTSPRGRLAYLALSPGRYGFYDVGFARQTSPPTTYWTVGKNGIATANNPNSAGFNVAQYKPYDAAPFSVPFEVIAGQATYLGNLHFVWGEATQTGRVMVRNEAPRDLKLLRERSPRIRPEQIRIAAQSSP